MSDSFNCSIGDVVGAPGTTLGWEGGGGGGGPHTSSRVLSGDEYGGRSETEAVVLLI